MAHDRPLWAPWRIDFIRSEKATNCFLCDHHEPIPNNDDDDDEALIVFRGKKCFVILNRYPYNSGHLLVAPYCHTGELAELEATDLHELMDLTVLSQRALKRAMQPDAFNVGLNLGSAAGAGVADHVHMHIVPRWNGDTNFMSVIDDVRVVPEALQTTAKILRAVFTEIAQ